MPRKGGKRKKTRTHTTGPPVGANIPEEEKAAEEKNVPRSIVAKVSKIDPHVRELILDVRKLMGPFTATNLREKSYNRIKDYAGAAGQLGVTHLLIFSQTEINVIMRLVRIPDGPTLHFKVNQYTLCRHVRATLKRPYDSHTAYLTPPLVVLNNFSQAEDSHVKLMRVSFQHMFPTINIKTIKLNECRRVALFHLQDDGSVQLRHYAIRANPVGVNKSIKRVLNAKIPDLGELADISEFISGEAAAGGDASDSEMEDEASHVRLPDNFIGKGNNKSQQSAMKLTELGPRLTLELYKVEQGVNQGDVLYHKFVQKTPEEAAALKARIEKQRKLKEQRRSEQEANVQRKQEELEQKRLTKSDRKRRRLEGAVATGDGSNSSSGNDADVDAGSDGDEDDGESVGSGGSDGGDSEFEEEEIDE